MQIIQNSLGGEKPFVLPPATIPQPPARSEAAQVVLSAALYATLLRDHLTLSERNSSAIEKHHGLPPSVQYSIGYRSAPETPSARQLERWDTARRQHERLDSLSDDEFFDWLLYEKEHIEPRAPEDSDPYTFIEEELTERFGAVEGIPGCYLDGEYLRLKTLPNYSLIVPCRVDGIIRALQIFRSEGSSFFWWSTPDATGGARARASIHVANESLAQMQGIAVIVEHTIAADASAWSKHLCAVACNGLSPRRFVRELRAALPNLKRVALSAQLENLARALREYGYTVRTFNEGNSSHD